MFAYCKNNPVMLADSGGYAAKVCIDDTTDELYVPWRSAGGGGKNHTVTLPDSVHSKAMSFYNGVRVIEVPFWKDTAFSIGTIFIAQNVADDEMLLAHEYGHCIQLEEVGMRKYLQYVALPSVTCWVLTRLHVLSSDDYYDRPWECLADMYGNVPQKHAEGAEEAALKYWEVVKAIEYPEF